jgi:calcineurin-like phosphoesterase family protein
LDGKEKQLIVLHHYAQRVWNKSHYGSWHLYGHSHNKLPEIPGNLSFDIGVDGHQYQAWSYEEVKEKMSRKIEERK